MRGHVRKKGNNYYVVLELDRDENGKRRRITLSVRKELGLNRPATKRQAEQLLVKKLREIQEGTFIEPNDMTVGDLLDRWMESHGETNLKQTTYETHLSCINNHIKPAIGHIPLAKLRPLHLQQLYTDKLKGGRADGKPGGLSSSSVRYMHMIMHTALSAAVKWDLVARNVADAVTPPKVESVKQKTWTADEARKFLDYIREHRLYPLYYLALTTGMRRGELLGLRWQDINWEQRTLSINQTLVTTPGGQNIISSTKTESSNRVVALSAAMIAELRRHRKRQLEEMMVLGINSYDQELVFVSEVGTPINPRNLLRHFQTTAKKARLPVIPFHCLRHTSATLMLQQGIHPKVVAERLGHSRITTTLDTYSHVLPNIQAEAADVLEQTLALETISSTEGRKTGGTLPR